MAASTKIDTKTRVVVLMGGLSSEREVSLDSGGQVFAALVAKGYHAQALDWTPGSDLAQLLRQAGANASEMVVWNALHGAFGEDGCVQGLLECLRIPYTGSDPQSSAVSMDKVLSKQVCVDVGVPTPPWHALGPRDDAEVVAAELGYPLVVKPAREGSTVGITICQDASALGAALELARRCQGQTMLERFVPGKELSVGVLDGRALGTVEIRPRGHTYDYEAKYKRDDTEYLVPAPVSMAVERALLAHSETLYATLGCAGHARVDYRVDPSDGVWLLELNTLPGMTSHSLLPKMAEHAGIDFPSLCERILLGARLHR